ncbi:hypothetical protein M409DRAFT_30127 [Zasmidium cellare ATCC 36951]|uniref:Uncharacterized protein n=1 Tax=Zasmidium cellare ATCC 36951 TaxID=1080233 RepID=A0A6A6C0Z1_ZASCE|nr:uncharacterized protein M409DRAFT_30127 [Zasmidium cellare ATCC 36951]KAF2159376.1 hypothetical protein M409DRAFT_30127 [Zasmidium cellare ATCC 36951]
MKRKMSVKDRVQARLSKLRKQPVVTPEQKLHCKLETLNKEAEDLQKECEKLQAKAVDFTDRASTTQAPEPPPADRKPLFQRDQPGSRYEAQVAAVKILNSEWHSFEKNGVRGFETKLSKFEAKVQRLKRSYLDPKAPMGTAEHQFEGLDNAIVNLKKQRVELSKAVAKVRLPAALPVKK